MSASKIETKHAESYLLDLSRQLGLPIETVVRAESKSILMQTMGRTPARSVKTVKHKVRRVFNNYSKTGRGKGSSIPKISEGKNRVWYIVEGKVGSSALIMNGDKRWPDKVWSEYQSLLVRRAKEIKVRTQEMLRRRGLAKQSWLLLAGLIGARLKAAGFVVNARVNGRVVTEAASVLIDKRPDKFSIRFTNQSKATRFWKGEKALISALQGRAKFFATNLKRGVFKTAETIAKKYPGIYAK